MKSSLASDKGVLSKASPQACATEIAGLPPGTAPSEPRAFAWLRYAFWGACVVLVVGCLYGLSLGPVTRFYIAHPPIPKPGVMMYTYAFKGTPGRTEQFRISPTFPRWVYHVYSPAFRLLSSREGKTGLASVYRRYWEWRVGGKEECSRNLRQ